MNSGVGCHALLKGIFLTHWLNLCLFYFLSPLGFFCSTTCEAPKPALLLLLLSLWSCLTLCDPIDGSPSGFPVPGILQARTLEWVVISLSNAWKWKVKVKSLSCVRLLTTPWTAGYQAPPSTGFSRQECWSGVPLPSPSCKLLGDNDISL